MSFPRPSDIGNDKSYYKFSMRVKEKNVFIYSIRHLILLYLITDNNHLYSISKFVNAMIKFLTEEIELLDSECLTYVDNNEITLLVNEYIEYKKENNI